MKARIPSSLFSLIVVLLVPVVLLSCDSGGASADGDDGAFSLDQGSFSATLEHDRAPITTSG